MKVFISFDYEGIGGIAFWKETMGNAYFNDLATKQISAFIDGIRADNPDAEIFIADSHSVGDNILWDKLPDNVRILRGFPRTYYMVEELDKSYTHLVLFGYHTAIGCGGMMDHTYSGSSIYEIKINGVVFDEAMINAYFAGELGVPLSFVYGDDKTIQHLKKVAPGMDGLVSKKAISRFAGVMEPYNKTLKSLHDKGKTLAKVKGTVLKMKPPYLSEMTMTDSTRAYLAAIIPGVTKIENRKISFKIKSFDEFYRYLQTIAMVCAYAKNVE